MLLSSPSYSWSNSVRHVSRYRTYRLGSEKCIRCADPPTAWSISGLDIECLKTKGGQHPRFGREAASRACGGSPASLPSTISSSLFRATRLVVLVYDLLPSRGCSATPFRSLCSPFRCWLVAPNEDVGAPPALGGGAPAAKICIPVQRPYGLGAPLKESASR